MTAIKDSQTDPSLQLISKKLLNHELPAFVKTANTSTPPRDVCGLRGFAMPKQRLFPCHTKSACYLSHAYYHAQRQEFSTAEALDVKRTLDMYADGFGILDETNKLAAIFESHNTEPEMSAKIASHLDSIPPADIIRYARTLQDEVSDSKTASQADQELLQYAFPSQPYDFEWDLAKIASSFGYHDLDQLVTERRSKNVFPLAGQYTPRAYSRALPTIVDNLTKVANITEGPILLERLGRLRTFESPVISLKSVYRFQERDILGDKLAAISALSPKALVEGPLKLPVANWQDMLETSDDKVAGSVLRYLLDSKTPCNRLDKTNEPSPPPIPSHYSC